MQKTLRIDMKKVHDIHALFLLFEKELGKEFGYNLDGLSDVLSDEDGLCINITQKEVFERNFDEEATKLYFDERYCPGMPTLAEILVDIFEETSTLEFEVLA